MIKPSTRVYRKQVVKGVSIPAIIHNGNYYFVDLEVYEDGRVECWNFEDLESFKRKVKSGWIVLNVPDSKAISIHGLGAWAIRKGSWTFDSKSFVDYVLLLIKEMNPRMENIYQYTQKIVNGVRIGESGGGIIYKDHKRTPRDPFPEKIRADSVNMFYRSDDEYWLVKVNVFADSIIEISRLRESFEINLKGLEELITNGTILTEIPRNAKVNIYGLGTFQIETASYAVRVDQKLLEIRDIQRKLSGIPSSLEICREAYDKYLENPTYEQKEILKVSYENVPDHQKMFVGDMDTKDIQVRMILYGEQEIEKWSHFQVAKQRGEKLPTLTIPKLKEE